MNNALNFVGQSNYELTSMIESHVFHDFFVRGQIFTLKFTHYIALLNVKNLCIISLKIALKSPHSCHLFVDHKHELKY